MSTEKGPNIPSNAEAIEEIAKGVSGLLYAIERLIKGIMTAESLPDEVFGAPTNDRKPKNKGSSSKP